MTNRQWWYAAGAFGVATLTMSAAAVMSRMMHVPLRELTSDPNVVSQAPFYVGMFSQVGVIGWAVGATAAFFGAFASAIDSKARAETAFFAYAGILTLSLCLDDAMMLHEGFYPVILNVSEKAVLGLYALFATIFVALYWRLILTTKWALAIVGMGSLAASMVLDIILPTSSLESAIEDGFKLAGILCWAAYMVLTAFSVIRPGAADGGASASAMMSPSNQHNQSARPSAAP